MTVPIHIITYNWINVKCYCALSWGILDLQWGYAVADNGVMGVLPFGYSVFGRKRKASRFDQCEK